MKKITVLAAAFAFFGLVSVDANAQTQSETQTTQSTQQQQAGDEKKEKITQQELPQPVQQALTSESFKDWTVSEVYKVGPDAATAGAKPTYEVFFTNAEQKKAKIRLDEEGNVVASKDKETTTVNE
ncbi:hypothetical protein [Pontibacter harenae]|uniref:hypothetical protein n=1 Tax=Pontibacter harenae TaxID=2894083 RepID=UPI001E3645BB|nr:hypothetical protein [Pontibacter harenae]MCC9167863.1 hypothetical protein [Pontibacter harenae]